MNRFSTRQKYCASQGQRNSKVSLHFCHPKPNIPLDNLTDEHKLCGWSRGVSSHPEGALATEGSHVDRREILHLAPLGSG